jgi:hypothetical protein
MKKHIPLVVLVFLVVIKSCSIDQRMRCIEIDVETWTGRMEIELNRAKRRYDEAVLDLRKGAVK